LYSFYNNLVKTKTITDDLYNHLIKSLRFKKGDCFLFFDELYIYECKITTINKDNANFEILNTKDNIETNKPFITLIQGLPKKDKCDFICKYATLFNVKEIIFVYMKRSIPEHINIENKLNRLNKIVLEAVSISKRTSVPKITIINNIKDIVYNKFDNVYLCDEEESKVIDIKRENNIAIIIGPEGGIDNSEREYLKDKCISISLGKNILTTEAASLAILSKFL